MNEGLTTVDMQMETFAGAYRDWLLNEMRAEGYSILFDHLYNTEFKWVLDMDEHRAEDGRYLRDRFENISGLMCLDEWLEWPCSFLEMVVALAYSIEDRIMYDPEMGARTSEWFWMMLTNLGLHICSDRWMGQEGRDGLAYVDEIINTVMLRTYNSDGSGGLFPLKNPEIDQRDVEIWSQANSYIIEQEWC